MLGLTLQRDGDFILVGDNIEIRVLRIHGINVRLGLWVPREVKVLRGSIIVRTIAERGGDVDAILKNLPSAKSGQAVMQHTTT